MTDRELDGLGAGILALDKQVQRRLPAEPQQPKQQPADEPALAEWTAEQMARLDRILG